jgi:hypothetical protein
VAEEIWMQFVANKEEADKEQVPYLFYVNQRNYSLTRVVYHDHFNVDPATTFFPF